MIFPDLSSVKAKRKTLGLTQSQFSKECGASQSLIAKLESGKIEVSYEIVRNIFSALDRLSLKNEKKAMDVMSKKLVSIKADASVKEASSKMKHNNISQLPVFSGVKIIGSISESGIIDKLSESRDIFNASVKEIVEESFPIVTKNMPLRAIIPVLRESKAVLVSDNSKIVGIISKSDII